MLVDAGPADGRYDAGARVVVPFLRRSGVHELELLVISHAHRDHTGGAAAVEAAVPVRLIIDPGEPVADSAYQRVLATAARGHTRWQIVAAGDSFVVDGVRFRVVHPATGWWGAGHDLNEDSIVLEVRWREFTALLAGDAGIAAESSYVARVAPIDLLKVGHHGSRTATGSTLLSRRPPDAAVISLGTNRYGHPAPETLARLAAHDVAVWRTDREGPVTVTTDGHTFTVRGERSTRTFDATDP
jgi:competence protein ComEC